MQNQINTILSKLTISYRMMNEKLMSEIGLHAGQAQVLATLWARNGVSQADIVRELNISPPTVNSLVTKLRKAKFVKIKNCPKDKRLMRVYLTAKGSDIRNKAYEQWDKLETLILKDFSDTEKVLVLMLLEKTKNNLQTNLSEI